MGAESRNTLMVEDARVLSHDAFPGDQFVMRVQSPKIAALAKPGSFVHIRCSDSLEMRRPLSIMRSNANTGWVDLLYKATGFGTQQLSQRQVGDNLSMIGPIGAPFTLNPERPRALLIGGGVGIPPMVFIASEMQSGDWKPLAILGSEVPFPFTAEPSRTLVPGMPDGVIACMPLLEQWGIPSRLTSLQGYPGCHEGYVTDLANTWLETLNDEQRAEVAIYACGPHPMLKAVAQLAQTWSLPCQVSLEEFMACAVGGCAGCTVEIVTDSGSAMKRVCVDGPVFNAATVVF
ncbi:MAG TPA: dihydroorotate dehydrogenase electron transfer subunit [Chromatiales bacterium]|jgi:dihydroorotate dehydrogenase electron transfer subunit|nr:dihydroorotate dehydrogenase electron transfer subunit [Chromatiales bacterium]